MPPIGGHSGRAADATSATAVMTATAPEVSAINLGNFLDMLRFPPLFAFHGGGNSNIDMITRHGWNQFVEDKPILFGGDRHGEIFQGQLRGVSLAICGPEGVTVAPAPDGSKLFKPVPDPHFRPWFVKYNFWMDGTKSLGSTRLPPASV